MTWKKQLLEQAPELFEDGRRKDPPQSTAPMINNPAQGASATSRISNDQLAARNVTKNNARKLKRRPLISPGNS